MQKRVLFAIGIVMLCAAAATGYYLFNKPHEDTAGIAPGVDLSAQALYSAYQRNEKDADGRFLGKVVRVGGRVSEVNSSDSTGSLMLGTNRNGGINCSFGKGFPGRLKNIHTGDSVSCKGRCTGFLMDVNLSDCVIEK